MGLPAFCCGGIAKRGVTSVADRTNRQLWIEVGVVLIVVLLPEYYSIVAFPLESPFARPFSDANEFAETAVPRMSPS